MYPSYTLLDDGALDTVIRCDACQQELRLNSEGIERDHDGWLTDEGQRSLEEEIEHHCDSGDCLV